MSHDTSDSEGFLHEMAVWLYGALKGCARARCLFITVCVLVRWCVFVCFGVCVSMNKIGIISFFVLKYLYNARTTGT